MNSKISRARAIVGAILFDLHMYVRAAFAGRDAVFAICNRREKLERSTDGSGYRCLWQWTSDLHATKVIPFLGRWLMQRALSVHPVLIGQNSEWAGGNDPEISFIIGHRGEARLMHLLSTLDSIYTQHSVKLECIVVVQDQLNEIQDKLPAFVRVVHTPPPTADMPFCRSWAFNVGARRSRSSVLVFHDNDILVPTDYARLILDRVAEGYEAVNLKRFIFYLSKRETEQVFSESATLSGCLPESVMQNAEGGGSVAITKDAFWRIGGFDESFVGWGGEDNEFWQRALTLRAWVWGCLPMVHLWHPAQPGKSVQESETIRLFSSLSALDPAQRISRLAAIESGSLSGPFGHAFRSIEPQ